MRSIGGWSATHGTPGRPRATLGAVADAATRGAIRLVDHPEIRKTLSTLPLIAGNVILETLAKPDERRCSVTLTRRHAEGDSGEVWAPGDAAPLPATAAQERPPAQAALVVGTTSMGLVAVTHTFADLVLAYPSRTRVRSATPGARRRSRP